MPSMEGLGKFKHGDPPCPSPLVGPEARGAFRSRSARSGRIEILTYGTPPLSPSRGVAIAPGLLGCHGEVVLVGTVRAALAG